ncbi:hypothetical protein LTR20_001026 [Exophiala xenobiotica]|nr:hypothetical protein LTR40_003857 [Exophiala xenobiotica]KAK5374735.1 hypothetical protein LTS13_005303 [Exophiala xenobiotica]KAK5396886.1 hypothetical protein LTR79_005522 [Exophiala xenobiotica]KAK5410705.1 hypothetical protein LTR90_008288 [Exophiala xenobiotica]KAK5470765.1 hypothetical protein LTR20_001026 [Exophiala xenobiotica]
MAPRSPTHAFDPTPPLEHDPDNFSPLAPSVSMEGSSNGNALKGVRFSERPLLLPQGRHSIATTNVPLLPSVASASQIPKHGFQMTNPTHEVDITAYIEQCRLLNTQLREAHDCERRAWDIERTALKARIAELERKLNRNFKPSMTNTTNRAKARSSSDSNSGVHPVWQGPEIHAPATRVFSHEDTSSHLPSISENEPLPPLSKEISPTTQKEVENVPVPVEQVDKSLDGITLKSAALTSSFDTGITSPQFASPLHTPSPQPPRRPPEGLLQVDVKSLLSPLDEKLKRHAGHTPMAFDGTLSSGTGSAANLTPRQEKPVEPAPTKRPPLQPSENSESYFSFSSAANDPVMADGEPLAEEVDSNPQHEAYEDPALKGPLMLDPGAKSESANVFLERVDAMLSEEAAVRSRYESALSEGSEDKKPAEVAKAADVAEEAPARDADDDGPRLKIKNSMNFGSAWGGDMPGRI